MDGPLLWQGCKLMGLFYLLTYNMDTQRGYWWTGGFFPTPQRRSSRTGGIPFTAPLRQEVAHWDYRLIGTTAEGYFRAMIRRHPAAECWAWAIEWNQCLRLVGFFGCQATAQNVFDRMPRLTYSVCPFTDEAGSSFRYRMERPTFRSGRHSVRPAVAVCFSRPGEGQGEQVQAKLG